MFVIHVETQKVPKSEGGAFSPGFTITFPVLSVSTQLPPFYN